jgi:hypothetical protein
VATTTGTSDVMELGWQVGFGFEVKLDGDAWGHLSLYRGVGGVRKD